MTWIYLAMSAAALLSASDRVSMLHSAASHGKLLLSPRYSVQKTISSWIYVSKSFFGHFYAVGLTVSSLCIIGLCFEYDFSFGLLSRRLCGVRTLSGDLSSKDAIFVLGLLWLHEARRLYECIFVHRWGRGLMSLLAYSVGLLHYILAPFAVLCEVETESSSSVERWRPGLGQLIGAVLVVVASVVQHIAHRQFAELRMDTRLAATTSHHQSYKLLPHRGSFRRVSCPHYTAEIFLYYGLLLVAKMGGGGGGLRSMFCFVVSNLTVSAYRMHAWYERTFGEAFKTHRRARLLPGLW